jgi:tetratricopeptide (TPR) repeat protein
VSTRKIAAARLEERIAAGSAAHGEGRLEEAAQAWESALRSAVRLPTSALLRATLRNNLAGVYQSRRQTGRAERAYRRALEELDGHEGADELQAAMIRGNLAQLLRDSGREDDAAGLFEAALTVFERLLDPANPQLAVLRNNLAGFHTARGGFPRAEELYAAALAGLDAGAADPALLRQVLLNYAATLSRHALELERRARTLES